ncbi:DUF3397 domain-containing protein [Saliterribacillus persicus]|uniref:Uncharacterized protein DUF3397 n=1 Tax=Saliterribacillus persicus TaxID=930114 RepID=A0A368XS58_9BACI|nr:DUF3397 domain-containing protein [Saliterribacillus persicus]RCW70811.1 uncharacterized protein DUF3397 [Saliterribacillus persicus]
MNLLAYLLAFILTFPLIITIVLYYIGKLKFNKKWKAIHFATDWTTILYIFSVSIACYIIFEKSYIGIIIIILILLFILFLIVQWKTKTEVILRRVWKPFWKTCFLLFFVLYFILIIYGIILYLIQNL